MRVLRISVAMTALLFLLSGVCLSGTEEEDFPKIGFVKNNGSNVRAGDNINFESLCKMRPGDPVKIIGERYSWFKIVLPKKAHLYIKNDYADLTPEKVPGDRHQFLGVGVLNAVRVNLRAGPGTRYSILGQVSKPDELKVIAEEDGWYEIEPPEGTAGWIHTSQVTFSLVDTEPTLQNNQSFSSGRLGSEAHQ